MALSSARGKLIGVIGDEVGNLKNTGINLHLIFRTLVLVFSLGALVSSTRTGVKAFLFFFQVSRRESDLIDPTQEAKLYGGGQEHCNFGH